MKDGKAIPDMRIKTMNQMIETPAEDTLDLPEGFSFKVEKGWTTGAAVGILKEGRREIRRYAFWEPEDVEADAWAIVDGRRDAEEDDYSWEVAEIRRFAADESRYAA